MVFSSTIFLFCFFPVVLILYYLPFIKSIKYKNIILVLASLLFYAWGEPVYVFLMMASVLINWLFGLLVNNYKNKKVGLSQIIKMNSDSPIFKDLVRKRKNCR